MDVIPVPELNTYRETLEILDAHHHFWDLTSDGYWPWIQGPVNEDFFLGDYGRIRRQFSQREYLQTTSAWNIQGSIHCEAERVRDEQLAEVQDLSRMHATPPYLPTAIIGHVSFLQDDREEVLERYAAHPLVCGVRSKPRIATDPYLPLRDIRGSLQDEAWLSGFQLLSDMGLTYDLRVPYYHLHEAAEALMQFPDLRVVLNHCGLPLDRRNSGLAQWEDGMRKLASREHTYVKVSEFGLYPNRWDPLSNIFVAKRCFDIFGYSRSMFASNLPVALVCAPSFEAVMSIVLSACRGASANEVARVFKGTAAEVYEVAG